MRTKLTIGTAAAIFLLAAPAFAEDWDFILTNNTGKQVKTVELSPAGAADWKPNIVDPEMKREGGIATGGRATVHFDKAADKCRYDVKLTFADDTVEVWTSINVCDNSYVTLRYAKDGKPNVAVN